MRIGYYLPSLLGLLLCFSCSKEALNLTKNNSSLPPKISFDNLKSGQQSRYVLLLGEDYSDSENHNFQYIKDTMIVEIIEKKEDRYLVAEYLTEGSASKNGTYHVGGADKTYHYYFKVENEILTVQPLEEREPSRIFFLGEKGLNLMENEDLKVEIEGWKTSLPFTEKDLNAYTLDYYLFDIHYPYLNVIIDNQQMTQQLPGDTHIYSAEAGLVRSTQYNNFTHKGFGWDLLP